MRLLARVMILLCAAALAVAPLAAAGPRALSFRLGSSFFIPSDDVFREVYGSGPALGIELGLSVGRGLEAWLSGSTFGKTGKLTYTGEETKIRLTPVLGGIRYYFTRTRLQPYAGVGAGMFFYKETSPLGSVKDRNFGVAAHVGLLAAVTKGLVLNFRVGYSACKVHPADFEAQLGGIDLGLGIGLGFSRSDQP